MKNHRTMTVCLVGAFQVLLVTNYHLNVAVLYAGLIVSCLFLLRAFSFTPPILITFALGGIAGFFAEAIVVQKGAWEYARQDWLGLPYWLFLLWGSAGVGSYRLTQKVFEWYERT